MKAELLATDSSKWIRQLERVRHDFYHLPTYARLSASTDGGSAAALYVEEGDSALLLPIIKREIGGGTALWDATSPYGYPGPLVTARDEDPGVFSARALLAARGILHEAGCVSLFARIHPVLGPIPRIETTGVAAIVAHGETISVDLTASEEVMWRDTASGHRNEINRSLRAGHVARIDTDFAAGGRFLDLYRETMDRVGATQYYYFDNQYLTQLRDSLGPKLSLAVVEIDGVIAAAGLFVETCGIVEYHLSGSAAAYQKERPTKLMLDHVRKWAKARGNLVLHLGGGVGGAEDSLFRFKGGFSRGRAPFNTFRLIVDEKRYEDFLASRTAHAIGTGMERDTLTGFFPAYRK